VSAKKFCFMNRERPCDLTCKAAFEVDDPVDNVDCYFIWLAHHFGEGLFEVRRILENVSIPGFPPSASGAGGEEGGGGGEPPSTEPRKPKGPSKN
jgi:hypothetical protein